VTPHRFPAHSLAPNEVLKLLNVSLATGLSEDEAKSRLKKYGPNTIVTRVRASAFRLLLHQFHSPVFYLLAAAALLAFWFGELEEGTAIAVVLAINALIGFMTELKAARSIDALRMLGAQSSRVRRGGHVYHIPAEHIVPGDVVLLTAGDSVPADLRLVEASNVAVDESMLTGESVSIEKTIEPVSANAQLSDRRSTLFKGTNLTRGSSIGVAVSTGFSTELGRVAHLVEEAEPGSSPLEKQLAHLSAQLIWATLVIAAVVGISGVIMGKDLFLMAEAAIALAVAAIPEGLPIVATLALARGMWRMAQQNALIERLSAVETLGSTTVILTDKTGTLTENRMTVRRLWVTSGEIDVESEEYDDSAEITKLLNVGILCNEAWIENLTEQGSGDPMEIALLRAGLKRGISRSALLLRNPTVHKHAFDTSTKMMATVHACADQFLFAVKGAPEAVLAVSNRGITETGEVPMDPNTHAEWLRRADLLGHHGLRVLACATKTDVRPDVAPFEKLTFLGLIGLDDPARADVPGAVRDCQQAGIRVVMVTGDHAVTARTIARAVGLRSGELLQGKDIELLAQDKNLHLSDVSIFARVSPSDKLQLVRAFQASGEVVAMTGDGVNDAPALRQADIGVAMGLRGTDVARQAAAMILLDDAFATIVKAIHEGRVIFKNIRRFVAYLLSCNLAEVLVISVAVVSSLPLPVMPLQILYLNLLTDVFPAFALALGEGERDVLKESPRNPKEHILGRARWIVIVLQSLTLAAATFGALGVAMVLQLDSRSIVTVTFLTLAFSQLWHVFNMRRPRSHTLRNETTRNPWLWGSLGLCTVLLAVPPYLEPMAHVLQLEQPTPVMWSLVLGWSAAPLILIQTVMGLWHVRSQPTRAHENVPANLQT
jgi:P-type Ca2+ transporter type 2C